MDLVRKGNEISSNVYEEKKWKILKNGKFEKERRRMVLKTNEIIKLKMSDYIYIYCLCELTGKKKKGKTLGIFEEEFFGWPEIS